MTDHPVVTAKADSSVLDALERMDLEKPHMAPMGGLDDSDLPAGPAHHEVIDELIAWSKGEADGS